MKCVTLACLTVNLTEEFIEIILKKVLKMCVVLNITVVISTVF